MQKTWKVYTSKLNFENIAAEKATIMHNGSLVFQDGDDNIVGAFAPSGWIEMMLIE